MSELEQTYRRRYFDCLQPLATELECQLREYLQGVPRIDRITARAKTVESFAKKAGTTTVNGNPKYSQPLDQIQDQIGARIITFYRSDVDQLGEMVMKYYRSIETKNHLPESEWEFGYFGRHYVLLMPSDLVIERVDVNHVPRCFELQIKTLFQHAWSEAEHDLGYKPGETPLSSEQMRLLAFTSAQAWGADHMFDELFLQRQQAAT
jgi:putative GTP pyrophosphokinase